MIANWLCPKSKQFSLLYFVIVFQQAKIGEMQQQRKMLTCQLRGQISSDDITKNLVGHIGTEADTFIEKQMKKHREVADLIQQNLAAQENILS